MILSIRGTSGSGKTTIAKRVLHGEGVYHPAEPVFSNEIIGDIEHRSAGATPEQLEALRKLRGRGRPVMYTRRRIDGGSPIAVLGHYESETGGCDNISGNDLPFWIMRDFLIPRGFDVFFEGLLMAAEQHRTAQLHHDGHDVRLFYFNTSLQECLNGVMARRAARGNDKPLNPETTASRHRTLRLHPPRFKAMGVRVTLGDRGDAVRWLAECGVISDAGQ